MKYPVDNPADWERVTRLSPYERFRLVLRNRRRRGLGFNRGSVELHPVKLSAVRETPLDLICVARNVERYLPSFLRHYRRLGVQRFIFVDDTSEDATAAMLASQPDVDLFHSNVGYAESVRGLLWRDMLIDRYGRGRWYLVVDADEYLVYPGCETRGLPEFVRDLQDRSLKRSLAVLLDVYGSEAPSPTQDRDGAYPAPTDVACYFDGDGYDIGKEKLCTAIRGGPRARLFGTDIRMNKFPLIFCDEATGFGGGSIHGPLPLQRNFTPVTAALLHYRFPAGWQEDFETNAVRGVHFNNAKYYRDIVNHERFRPDMSFVYDGSERFRGRNSSSRTASCAT